MGKLIINSGFEFIHTANVGLEVHIQNFPLSYSATPTKDVIRYTDSTCWSNDLNTQRVFSISTVDKCDK